MSQHPPVRVFIFKFPCELPYHIPLSAARFIENRLREHGRFTGIPFLSFFRKQVGRFFFSSAWHCSVEAWPRRIWVR